MPMPDVNPCFYLFSLFSLLGIIISYWAIETIWNQKLESIDSSINVAHFIWILLWWCIAIVIVECWVLLQLDETIAITRFKCVQLKHIDILLPNDMMICYFNMTIQLLFLHFNQASNPFMPFVCVNCKVDFSKFKYGQIKIDCFDLTGHFSMWVMIVSIWLF